MFKHIASDTSTSTGLVQFLFRKNQIKKIVKKDETIIYEMKYGKPVVCVAFVSERFGEYERGIVLSHTFNQHTSANETVEKMSVKRYYGVTLA